MSNTGNNKGNIMNNTQEIIAAASRFDVEATRAAIIVKAGTFGAPTDYLNDASEADLYAIAARYAQEARENEAASAHVSMNVARFGTVGKETTSSLYPAKKGRTWLETASQADQFGIAMGTFLGCVSMDRTHTGRGRRYNAGFSSGDSKFLLSGFTSRQKALAALVSYWRTK